MALLITPASAFDFAETLDDGGQQPTALTPRRFGLFARQVAEGGALAFRDAADGALVMIGGVCAAAELGGAAEAWWAIGRRRERMGEALRASRRLFAEICADAAPLQVFAHIPDDSVAGARVAALFGLVPDGRIALPGVGPVTRWRRSFPALGPE